MEDFSKPKDQSIEIIDLHANPGQTHISLDSTQRVIKNKTQGSITEEDFDNIFGHDIFKDCTLNLVIHSGKTVGFVPDIHLHQWSGSTAVEEILQIIQNNDVVFFMGDLWDFFTGRMEGTYAHEALSEKVRQGILEGKKIYCLEGNHDPLKGGHKSLGGRKPTQFWRKIRGWKAGIKNEEFVKNHPDIYPPESPFVEPSWPVNAIARSFNVLYGNETEGWVPLKLFHGTEYSVGSADSQLTQFQDWLGNFSLVSWLSVQIGEAINNIDTFKKSFGSLITSLEQHFECITKGINEKDRVVPKIPEHIISITAHIHRSGYLLQDGVLRCINVGCHLENLDLLIHVAKKYGKTLHNTSTQLTHEGFKISVRERHLEAPIAKHREWLSNSIEAVLNSQLGEWLRQRVANSPVVDLEPAMANIQVNSPKQTPLSYESLFTGLKNPVRALALLFIINYIFNPFDINLVDRSDLEQ